MPDLWERRTTLPDAEGSAVRAVRPEVRLVRPVLHEQRETRPRWSSMTGLFDVGVAFLAAAFLVYVLGAKRLVGFSMSSSRAIVVVFVILSVATFLASTVSNV